MKKLSSKTILLISFSIAALILAALYVYLYLSLSKMGKDQQGLAGEVMDAQAIMNQEDENSQKLAAYFVADGDQAAFVSAVELQCQTLSLACTIQSLNEAPDPSGATKTLNLIILVKGSLAGIGSFISDFELSHYPIAADKMFLSRDDDSEGWEGAFDLSVPVLITNPQ